MTDFYPEQIKACLRILMIATLVLQADLPFSKQIANADTVELSGGGHLVGEVERKEDFVVVKVNDAIQIAIPASRVRRIVESESLEAYRELASTLGEDAEKHYQMALWCVRSKQVPGEIQKYKTYHLERAIELDPDHTKARAALGFTQENGRWIKTDQLMTERGMIPGRWAGNYLKLPQFPITQTHKMWMLENGIVR